MILRSILLYFSILSIFISDLQVFAESTQDNHDDCLDKIDRELGPRLSPKASIVHYTSAAPRWSSYHAPEPGTIVNVANENDVVETVKYCIENNLDFLTQSGAHGFVTTFHIDKKDLIINMRGLNQVHVSDDKDTITFEGGALVGEVADTANANQVEGAIPSCSCVGMSGATLGAGFNRLLGKYGFVIDTMLSVNLVTAEGKLITVTPESSPDLWWALRGAGANFGVVTSMTIKAYPQTNNGKGWLGTLIFTPDQLDDIIKVLSESTYTEEMFFFLLISQPPPDYTPTLIFSCFYAGPEAEALAAYKPLFDIGPVANTSGEVPSEQFYHVLDPACVKGLRKPAYSVGMKTLDPSVFRKIWDEYITLMTQYPELNQTLFLIEGYATEKIRTLSDSSSAFPHRSINFLVLVNPQYEDPKFDPVAEEFGKKVRQHWIDTSGFEDFRAYINYAHGDEDPDAIYGINLPRLKEIKKAWDPHGRFSQFFPIPTN